MSDAEQFDTIVVGGGAVGASALFQLTRHGVRRCLLLERKAGYGRGATGSWGALVRVYHESERNSFLAAETVPEYLKFEEITGHPAGFRRTGSLYFLKAANHAAVRARVDRLNSLTSEPALELLDAEEGKRRFPAFQWLDDDIVVSEPRGGTVDPHLVTAGWIRAAMRDGAEARTNEEVLDIRTDSGGRVVLRTSQERTYVCEQLVLASGVWTRALASLVGERLDVVPTVIQVNEFKQHGPVEENPLFIDLENLTFGCASPSGTLLAGYLHDRASDVDHVHHLSLREACEAKRRLALRLPWVKHASLHGGVRGVEGYTRDGQFILDFSAQCPNVLIATGWNCAGFILAPLVGRRIAERIASRLNVAAS